MEAPGDDVLVRWNPITHPAVKTHWWIHNKQAFSVSWSWKWETYFALHMQTAWNWLCGKPCNLNLIYILVLLPIFNLSFLWNDFPFHWCHLGHTAYWISLTNSLCFGKSTFSLPPFFVLKVLGQYIFFYFKSFYSARMHPMKSHPIFLILQSKKC